MLPPLDTASVEEKLEMHWEIYVDAIVGSALKDYYALSCHQAIQESSSPATIEWLPFQNNKWVLLCMPYDTSQAISSQPSTIHLKVSELISPASSHLQKPRIHLQPTHHSVEYARLGSGGKRLEVEESGGKSGSRTRNSTPEISTYYALLLVVTVYRHFNCN